MSLPNDFFQSTRKGQMRVDIERLYDSVQRSLNAGITISNFQATDGTNLAKVSGSAASGTATYTNQQGVYLREGDSVTYWFGFSWSGHTGSGDLRIPIPYTLRKFDGLFIGSCETQNITWPAGGTQIVLRAPPEQSYATVYAIGSGFAGGAVQLSASGSLNGMIRYIAKAQR